MTVCTRPHQADRTSNILYNYKIVLLPNKSFFVGDFIYMIFCDHKVYTFKASGCLIEVTDNTGFTVDVIKIYPCFARKTFFNLSFLLFM